MDNGNRKIVRIQCENFLMLTKMDYVPRPGMNIFAGKNAQGKTDVLRLLKAAFKGAGAETIQHGKDKAKIAIKIDDNSEIFRSITHKSDQLKVRTAEGDYKASPQTYLNALLGDDADLNFNPVEFALINDPKKQKQMILETFNIGKLDSAMLTGLLESEIIGRLDFNKPGLDVLKDAENIIYTKRSEINKEIAKKKTLYDETISKLGGFDPQTYKGNRTTLINSEIKSIENKLSDAKATKRQAEGTQKLVNKLENEIKEAEQELTSIQDKDISQISFYENLVDDIDRQIKELQAKKTEIQAVLENARKLKQRKDALEKIIQSKQSEIKLLPSVQDIPDIQAIETELTKWQEEFIENNKQKILFDIFEQAQHIKTEHDFAKEESDRLTGVINVLRDDLPKKTMQDINIPFKSLSFDGDHVLINDNRIDLMSTSEQLLMGLQIYKERNKNAKLKFVCCDRIEVLDDESYKTFWGFCMENDFQCFATQVISAQISKEAIFIEEGIIINDRNISKHP